MGNYEKLLLMKVKNVTLNSFVICALFISTFLWELLHKIWTCEKFLLMNVKNVMLSSFVIWILITSTFLWETHLRNIGIYEKFLLMSVKIVILNSFVIWVIIISTSLWETILNKMGDLWKVTTNECKNCNTKFFCSLSNHYFDFFMGNSSP